MAVAVPVDLEPEARVALREAVDPRQLRPGAVGEVHELAGCERARGEIHDQALSVQRNSGARSARAGDTTV